MSTQHNDSNTLKDIAAELASLADDLVHGKLRIGNRLVAIGNPLFTKTKQKITGNTAYFTLSFEVPLLDLKTATELTIGHDHPQKEPQEDRHDKALRLEGRPPEGKKIKKEITRLWKTVFKNMEQGHAPSPAEEKALVTAFGNYTAFSEPAWHDDWLTCFTLLREALAYAKKGDMRKALDCAMQVNTLTKTCHQKHK